MADTVSTTRRPSIPLLILGLLALGISGWVLFGPNDFHWLTSFDGRWALIAAAALVGLALVLAPSLRRRDR